jgi:hypothetical protein
MIDRMHAFKRCPEGISVADIPLDELSFRMQITGLSLRVNCRLKVIQYPNPMAFGDQGVSRMRSNETGAAGNEDIHNNPLFSDFCHPPMPLSR